MADILTLDADGEPHGWVEDAFGRVVAALESGQAVFFPRLAFHPPSLDALLAAVADGAAAKNISYDPNRDVVRGSRADGESGALLHAALAAYAQFSRRMLLAFVPEYGRVLEMGRTSFRPAEIAGRATSWRKDDTRLHVDSFPATPVQGRRILRFFSNVNPAGQVRVWRLGEPFEAVAKRFMPALRAPLPGSSALLRALRVTKSRRSAYDHYMLQLHDRMKADLDYQSAARQVQFEFPPGASWMVYTDSVSHAAMSGRYAFEQTFYIPVEGMRDAAKSPLRVLERMMERELA